MQTTLMIENFRAMAYWNSRYTSCNTNMILRIQKAFSQAWNKKFKAPRYIPVVLTMIWYGFLWYEKFGISAIYGIWLKHLAATFSKLNDCQRSLSMMDVPLSIVQMYRTASPHHFIPGSVSVFHCDDISALEPLSVGPLHHITLFLVQFQHSSVMTFLHINIFASLPPHLIGTKKFIKIGSHIHL